MLFDVVFDLAVFLSNVDDGILEQIHELTVTPHLRVDVSFVEIPLRVGFDQKTHIFDWLKRDLLMFFRLLFWSTSLVKAVKTDTIRLIWTTWVW